VHPGGPVGGEERHHLGHFLRRADAVERAQGRRALLGLLGLAGAKQVGVHRTRRYRVDAHLARRDFLGHRAQHDFDRGFRARIGPEAGHCVAHHRGRDGDDRAAVGDALPRLAQHVEGAYEVHFHQLPEVRDVVLRDRARRHADAGSDDDAVDLASVPLLGLVERALHVLGLLDIGLLAGRGHDLEIAVQRLDARGADAARAAEYQCQFLRHVMPPRVCRKRVPCKASAAAPRCRWTAGALPRRRARRARRGACS